MEELKEKEMFLISERCAGPFFMGWHIYLRDSMGRQQRNADGDWGWVRRYSDTCKESCHNILLQLGIKMRDGGDGTREDDGYAEFARKFPIGRQKIAGAPRGCIPVIVDRYRRVRIGEKAVLA